MTITGSLLSVNSLPLWRRQVTVWGHRMTACRGDRLLYLYLHRLGLMGREERKLLESQVHPGMCVADIGANHGLYTLLLAKLVGPSGQVLAFEPDPELFGSLRANCLANHADNVQLYNVALGAEAGMKKLFRSRVNAGDNRLTQSRRGNWFDAVPVEVATLDAVLAGRRLDFIKIDVQGWELEVLRGSQQAFRASAELKVYFEYWKFGLEQAGSNPVELLEYFKRHSFSIYEISGQELRAIGDAAQFSGRLKQHSLTNLLAMQPDASGGLK